MRSLIQVYALAVCFCALMCLIVALGFGLYDLVRIAAPGFTMNQYWNFATNEQYIQSHPEHKEIPEAELTQFREAANQLSSQGERRAAGQSLVFATIIVLIDAVVFGVHWSIAKRVETRITASASSP